MKEMFVSRTQIIMARGSARRHRKTMLGAPAMTSKQIIATLTVRCECGLFIVTKGYRLCTLV